MTKFAPTATALALALIAISAPYELRFDAQDGVFSFEPSLAHARRGGDDDDSGSDDSGSDDSSDDSGSDDSDNSGSDDSSDDDSSDDDGADDHSSGGHGADDGPLHDINDDSRRRSSSAASTPRTQGGGTVAKVEYAGSNIEIVYTDGWKEEVEAGRYELKDAAGNTVVQRSVTQSEMDRLFAVIQ